MKHKIYTLFFILFYSTSLFGQNKLETLRDSINKQLDMLSIFPETLYNPDNIQFDPDSLKSEIAHNVIDYLTLVGFENFAVEDFPNLELTTKQEGLPFEVITFGYNSGGTAGVIPASIIVKKESTGYKYFDMSDLEANFYQFYQLKDDLYLCYAAIPGWGACMNQGIYAFDFSGNSAMPVSVFNDQNFFKICNSNIFFDEKSLLLTIEVDNTPFYNGGSDYETYFENKGYNFFSIQSTDDEPEDFIGYLYTKFDGSKFVKPD